MYRFYFFLPFSLFVVNVMAQNKDSIDIIHSKDINSDEEIFLVVEDAPEFPGGDDSLFYYIVNNMRYPETAKYDSVEGLVVVNFVIDEEGFVKDAKVLKSVRDDLDAEALRVVNAMPRWIPGRQKGKAVKVRMNLPLRFNLKHF